MASSLSVLSILIVLVLAIAIIGGIVALIVYLANRGKEKPVDTNLDKNKSFFDGGYLAYIGYTLLVGFVTGITFGLAFPWMCCLLQRWKAKHTVICGKRMYFDGTGIQLIGKFILWSFLTIITFGIYGFWMSIAIKKWISKHTHFVGEEDNNSYFDGGVLGFIGTNILATFALVVPFVGAAWSNIIRLRWETKHTVTDSRRLIFTGTVGTFFLKYLLWGFLSGVTLGIFALFVPVKNMRLETENTIDNEHTTEAQIKQSEYRNLIRTDYSTYKSDNVEYEMEGIKSGITDTMGQEELLALANGGSRAAQYLYVTRYAEGNYGVELFASLLKAASDAEYAPAVCLYALTQDIEVAEKNALLDKAAKMGQFPAIRNRMSFCANLGLSQNDIAYLKDAVRYFDLLKEHGEELTEDELGLVKKCVLAIRKIESGKSVSSGGGKVVLAVIAIIAVLTIIIGLVCSLFMFKRTAVSMDRHDRPAVEAVY